MMNRRDMLKASLPIVAGAWRLPRWACAQATAGSLSLPAAGADGWISLLNGHDLAGWYSMLEKSGKDVAQTRKIVMMEQGMLHILGNEVTAERMETGYLATHQEFENVHIRVEYKWGVKRFPPQTLAKRDNGILYGLVGTDIVWPTCVECQIEEDDLGDAYLVNGVRGVQPRHDDGLFEQAPGPNGWPPPGSDSHAKQHAPDPEPTTGRKIKDGNFEILDGWNVVEVIWQGDRAAHIVNGRIVNVLTTLQQPDPNQPGKFIPLTRGKIAIEIEYAEIWYRKIEVKSLV